MIDAREKLERVADTACLFCSVFDFLVFDFENHSNNHCLPFIFHLLRSQWSYINLNYRSMNSTHLVIGQFHQYECRYNYCRLSTAIVYLILSFREA